MPKEKPQIAWTTRQDRILREFAHLGVKEVQREMRKRLGISRSVQSIKNRAARIGVSLSRQHTCPACGHVGGVEDFARHNGLCKVCNTQMLIERAHARNGQKRKEVERREFKDALRLAEKEYARVRKEGSRINARRDAE